MKKLKIKNQNPKMSGQAMLLTVLVLGGSILAASTVAGYLTLLKIRTSSDAANSAKALFAADTGIEWELCREISPNHSCLNPRIPDPAFPNGKLSNGATFTTSITTNPDGSENIKSVGESNNIFRAFEIGTGGATNSLPSP